MTQSLLKLQISRNSEIEFFENFLIYKEEKILCSDVDGIAYLYTRTRHSINFIPTGTSHTYVIYIRTRGIIHKISLSGQNNQDIFNKLVAALDVVIKPFVLVNLLLDYIKNNKLEIGDLTITPEGLYKKRTWWRSPELLPWSKYYNSNINKGYVFVLKKDESKKEYSSFYTRTLSSLNAAVLPDIINFIFLRNGILDEAAKKEIIERKSQLTSASAQDAIQEVQKEKIDTVEPTLNYCANCGNQVNDNSKFCGNCGIPISSK